MASLQMAYIMFDETIKRCVDYFKLDGKVYKDHLLHLYVMRIAFHFKCEYLTILDFVDYEMPAIEPKKVLDETVQHLKEIDYQFRYYFNGLWC